MKVKAEIYNYKNGVARLRITRKDWVRTYNGKVIGDTSAWMALNTGQVGRGVGSAPVGKGNNKKG